MQCTSALKVSKIKGGVIENRSFIFSPMKERMLYFSQSYLLSFIIKEKKGERKMTAQEYKKT